MKVIRWGLILGACSMLALASAQAPAKAGGTVPSRIDAIWAYANDRLDQQTDVFFEDGDFPASIQLLKLSSNLHPEDYDTVTNLGWMLENIEEWSAAEAVYKGFSTANPTYPDHAFALGDFYMRRKEYAKVVEVLAPVVAHPAGKLHANNYRDLAHAYERLKKLSDAERVWKQYIAEAPTDETAKANLGRVQKKLAAQK